MENYGTDLLSSLDDFLCTCSNLMGQAGREELDSWRIMWRKSVDS